MKKQKVVVLSEKAVRHFDTMKQASEYMGTTVQNVSQAIKRDGIIGGKYKVILQEPRKEFLITNRDNVQNIVAKEIFTRKPYSATSMWRTDGREEG